MEPKELSADDAEELLKAKAAVFIDVRDLGSWRRAHVPGALHVGDHNIQDFVAGAAKDKTTIVYCYHGYSSLGGAAFLISEGFSEVYSMTGGFAAWPPRPVEHAPDTVTERPPKAADTEEPPPPRSGTKPAPSRRRRIIRRLLAIGKKQAR